MLTLTQENAARTAHAAYCQALGRRDTPPSDFDSKPETRSFWMKFAELLPSYLQRMEEGAKVSEWAEKLRRELYEIPADAKDEPERAVALAWQAAFWHLSWVLDNRDELTAELILNMERHWRQWADKRTIKLGVR